jgi:predicted dehydrogenase
MEKIRLGIIGCGNMCGQHLSAFVALKDKMKISVTCDLSSERAERTKEILNADEFSTDYTKILDKVDAVLIALPHKLHYPVGKFFVENGKHVLMEKPLCNNEKDCLELTRLAEENNVKLMTAYPVRFWPEIIKLKEYVDSGLIGDVFQMTVSTDHYNPARDTRGTWMNCDGLGGGQFFSHGCHYIDILLWFLGEPVTGTHLGTNYGTPWMDREGTSHAVMKFKSGALGYHTGTWGARGTSNWTKFDIYGTKGTLSFCTIGENANKIMLLCNMRHPTEPSFTKVLWEKSSAGKNTEGEITHFIDCIINDKTPITNGRASLSGLRCIWKMYEAEQQGITADLTGLGLNEPFIDKPICTFDSSSPKALEGYEK